MKGSSFVKLWSKNYYYEDKFGIAFLQSVYIDNEFLEKFIPKNSVVVDIGANIGQFRHFVTYVLHAKKVYSFEPIIETYDLLKKNFSTSSYNYAIGLHKEHVFYVPDTSLMASRYQRNTTDSRKHITEINLELVEEVVKEKVIDLLKIDTEGSELEALMASSTIRSKVRFLLIEVSINRSSYGDIFEILAYIKKNWKQARLIYIGRAYYIEGVLDSVDLLFENKRNLV